jgi:hypothetical protein
MIFRGSSDMHGNIGLSDRIRILAQAKYIAPAVSAGRRSFSIKVRDVLNDLQSEGFPGGHTPQICTALRTAKFLRENGLELESIEGPPSKMSPTVVFNYRLSERTAERLGPSVGRAINVRQENDEAPAARALRLSEGLRGILKKELEEYGGGEAFLRWIRSEDENAA